MIVGTAGHVDHGKTTLVKALTGVDTDRLPEEKKRGLSIDLGFAYLPAACGEVVAFVDLPGHERFIHNMLCGAASIDFALLVVAADDGPMPQTREHLAILDLLGVRRGAVALTKVDRVPGARAAAAALEATRLLADSVLRDAPIFRVSAVTGEGVAALSAHLKEKASRPAGGGSAQNFRLCVDRCFTKAGAGLIVTGTVVSGRVETGQSVRALFAGSDARVRALHAQGRPAFASGAGERCALNLAGIAGPVARGEWIVGSEGPPPALRMDVRLRLLASEAKPLAHWTAVHVHHGASDVMGRVALLQGDRIAPGDSALAQLVLQQPLGAVHGDRFIVRDASALRTLGGGTVIDVYPPSRGRASEPRLASLRAMEHADSEASLDALLEQAREGVNLARFATNRNLAASSAAALYRRAARAVPSAEGLMGFSAAAWTALRRTALASLQAWHAREPDILAVPPARLYEGSGMRLSPETIAALCDELIAEHLIAREPMGVRLVAHRPVMAASDSALWERAKPLLEVLRPPSLAEIAAALECDVVLLESALSRLARHGLVVRVSKTRFFVPWALAELERMAIDEALQKGRITAAGFRDRSRIGRNLSIEVLEFFDRAKLTRRTGDARVLRRDGVLLQRGGDVPQLLRGVLSGERRAGHQVPAHGEAAD